MTQTCLEKFSAALEEAGFIFIDFGMYGKPYYELSEFDSWMVQVTGSKDGMNVSINLINPNCTNSAPLFIVDNIEDSINSAIDRCLKIIELLNSEQYDAKHTN